MAKDQRQGMRQEPAPSVQASLIQENDFGLKSEATDRILSLQRMLTANACTRKEIFAVLGTYYKLDQADEESSTTKVRQRAGKMLERDLTFLEEVLGYELCREYTGLRTIRYSNEVSQNTFRFSLRWRENKPVLLVLSVCDGKIILEKGEILCEKRQLCILYA